LFYTQQIIFRKSCPFLVNAEKTTKWVIAFFTAKMVTRTLHNVTLHTTLSCYFSCIGKLFRQLTQFKSCRFGLSIKIQHAINRAFKGSLCNWWYYCGYVAIQDVTKLSVFGDEAPQLVKLSRCISPAKRHLHIMCSCQHLCVR
jgi:hypothetical protein